jgi:alpha-mannosidase
MKFSELTVLLPCHSLEDFPAYHEGTAADELLAAWCAPWHPVLLASAQSVPNWHRIDIPPETLAGRLLAVPPFCVDRLPAGFIARAENEGALVVRESTRDTAVARAMEALDGRAAVDPELAADFLALGFCRLQMELLTRQMRYSPNIDETHFRNEAVAAANAAVAGRPAESREHLQQCFDTLYESRKHVYPVDVYLLDVTLVAETTLGEPLAAELTSGTPQNLLAPASVFEYLKAHEPENWSQLLAAIDAGNACALGGDTVESELPLWPLESALKMLRSASDLYEQLLGRRPQVYGRRRAGLWPGLVQLLTKLAYQGALHFTLDDGRFPLGPQCKTRWEGLETSVIDIFARVPADAARPETFLGLARAISDSMDTDHVATVAFAHWPGATSPWYAELRRICRLSPVLGKFMLLDDYFLHTDMPGRLTRFEADDYRTPYLKQAIIRRESDPISRIVGLHRTEATRAAASAVSTVCDLIAQPAAPAALEPLDSRLARLADSLPRAAGAAAPRSLVFNPATYPQRVCVELTNLPGPPAAGGAVIASGTSGSRHFAVVDVPAVGFVWLDAAGPSAPTSTGKPIAAENTLTNEFFELKISRATGGIASLFNFNRRGNQLSQQLAFRSSAAGDAAYTKMQADSVAVTASCPAYGEITSTGSLVDESGRAIARFRQVASAFAGSPLARLCVELSDIEEPRADPWNSYYAARFAWGDETCELYRGVSLARQKTAAGRIEAPEFLEIDSGAGTVTLLTGGLPYHRRSDPRMLDTLLVVRGETARRFELAIGVDLGNPASAAFEFVTPLAVHLAVTPPPATTSGWFFHSGAKNIVATHWEPVVSRGSPETGPPQVKGFRVRLLEVGGHAGRVPLHVFRPVQYARQIDFLGDTILELGVDNDKIMIDFGPYEFLELEALWQR